MFHQIRLAKVKAWNLEVSPIIPISNAYITILTRNNIIIMSNKNAKMHYNGKVNDSKRSFSLL